MDERASLVTSVMHGSKRSFQLVRGYNPSMLGISFSNVHEELVKTYIELNAVLEIQKVMSGYTPHTVLPTALYPGRDLGVLRDITAEHPSALG